ncbi:MAG: hypothetical protein JEY79_09345 [Pseudodesulfovibrio sp.]|nr:hypothetical protein [Pseudodesulfovibrio sp.]
MTQKKTITTDSIWWRNVQPGEFYNIERYHRIGGGGGSLYIEIPGSMVAATLDFLDVTSGNLNELPVTINAGTIGKLGIFSPIEFQKKSGGRMRIVNQNRQQPNSQRHPAWTADLGFPTAPDDVRNKEEALPYFPKGGLRIYISKTAEGEYFAGFTQGTLPARLESNSLMKALYPQRNIPGGVINA